MTATFPQSPLDLRCEIGVNGWTDVSTLAYQREGKSPPVTATRGRPDETPQVTPSSASWQFNNRGGNFSPLNPLGAYYGQLGRNTQARWSVPAQGNYLRLEDMESAAACPDTVSLEIYGDTDIRVDMTLTGIGAFGTIVASKAHNDLFTGTQDAGWTWLLAISPDLTPLFAWSVDGTTVGGQVSGQLPVPARGRFALRATVAISTATVTFYTASDMSGTWTQLGPAGSDAAAAGDTIAALGVPLSVGQATGVNGASILFGTNGAGICGRVHELQMLDGIGGTLVADPVFSAQTAGVTSFADSQGNTWAMYGYPEISSRDYRYHGEMSSLPPRWDSTGTDQWVPVKAGGLLRRLGQGAAPLLAPMTRYWTTRTAPTLAAYWPMDDPAGATQLGALAGQQPLHFSGAPKLASSSAFTGSSPLPVLNGATFAGQVSYAGTWAAIDVKFLLALPAAGDPAQVNSPVVANIYTTGTIVQLQLLLLNGGGLLLLGYDSSGAQVIGSGGISIPAAGGYNGEPGCVQVALTVSGGTVTVTLAMILAGAAGLAAADTATYSLAGAAGAVTRVALNPAGSLTTTAAGHLAVSPAYTPPSDLIPRTAPSGAGTGPMTSWQYEPAGVRAGRLCAEEGIQFRGVGNLAGTSAMGVQATSDVVSLWGECEAADRGILFEPRTCLGIGYRARSSLYNQVPLVLDYSSAQLGGTGKGLSSTYDDQYTRNDETVSRSGGSGGASARFMLDDGSSMSTGVIGTYAGSDSLNLAWDGQLLNLAAWIVRGGTVDEARWPSVPLNLARSQLAALWWSLLDLDLGDRFQLQHLPDVVLYDPADQLAVQLRESLGGFHYRTGPVGIPASPYSVAAAGTARAATAGTVLAAAATSSATTLYLQVTAGNAWVTDSAQLPLDLAVSGERVTATAIAASAQQSIGIADGTFGTGVSAWQAFNGTVVQSSSQHHTGSFSAQVTATTSAASAYLRPVAADYVPVTPGAWYTCSLWIDAAQSGTTFQAVIDWYDAAKAYLSSSSGGASSPSSFTWTEFQVTGQAPAGAAFASYGPTMAVTASGSYYYCDDVLLTVPAQSATVTRSVNGVAKAHLAGDAVQVWTVPAAAL